VKFVWTASAGAGREEPRTRPVMDRGAVYCCLDDDNVETSAAAAAADAAGKLEENGARIREVIAGAYAEMKLRGKSIPTKHRGTTGDDAD